MKPPARFVMAFPHRLDAGNYCPTHSHGVLEIVFHPSGSGVSRTEGGHEFRFGPGDAVIYIPEDAHDQRMESAGTDHCIQMEVLDKAFLRSVRASFIVRALRQRSLLMELGEMAHWREEGDPAARGFRAAAVLSALLWEAKASRRDNATPGSALALEAGSIVSTELSSPPSLKEVARRLRVSPDYLRHAFKDEWGVGMKSFSLDARISRAKELLIHSPMRLKEIAAE